MNVKQNGLIGGLFALPWCCIIPAGFSLLGLAGVAAVKAFSEGLVPFFLLASLYFLGRANYLILLKHQGNRTSHVITWGATLLAIGVWGIQWAA